MLYKDFTEKLVGLQGLNIKNIEANEKSIEIYAEMERKEHNCICCGTATNTVHDYRKQVVKDINAFGKSVRIILRKRRYRCNHCGKRFIEDIPFLPKYHRMTSRLIQTVIEELRNVCSFTSVGKDFQLSVSTVIRIFDYVSYPKAKLPTAVSIDEFKGDTRGETYQCILTDPVEKRLLDILPERYGHYLTSYFKDFPEEERNKVEYFVSDMWKTYSSTADVWFKNATQIVDKYHWIRQAIWAFENVRKEEQKKLSPELRRYFKKSKSLLIKRFDTLDDENKQAVNVMLYYSVNISRAHWLKEKFLQILSNKDPLKAKEALIEWIQNAENCGIPQFERCANTMRN